MSSLFFDEEEAVSELKERGYRVEKVCFKEVERITTLKDLSAFFYYKRRQYNLGREYNYEGNIAEDSKPLNTFVAARQKLGLGRKQAIQEAARITDALFKYEKYLKLKAPIISPHILSSVSLVNRVCSYMNGEVPDVLEQETSEYIDQINALYVQYYDKEDIERIDKERKSMLEKINVERS